jgi:hypothetical protein
VAEAQAHTEALLRQLQEKCSSAESDAKREAERVQAVQVETSRALEAMKKVCIRSSVSCRFDTSSNIDPPQENSELRELLSKRSDAEQKQQQQLKLVMEENMKLRMANVVYFEY